MQYEALTLAVTQRILPQRRSGSPARPVQRNMDQAPYLLIGSIFRNCFLRGFFPGSLLSANFPPVLEIILMTSLKWVLFPLHHHSHRLLECTPYLISCRDRRIPALAVYSLVLAVYTQSVIEGWNSSGTRTRQTLREYWYPFSKSPLNHQGWTLSHYYLH